MIPAAKYAHDALLYEPVSGRLIWKHRPEYHFEKAVSSRTWNTKNPGSEVFIDRNKTGHGRFTMNKTRHSESRVMFLLMEGRWPEHQIDHINGDPTDNRWSNLREVTAAENSQNLAMSSANTSGRMGVSFNKRRGKWQASIKVNGRGVALYWGTSFNDAVAAREAAEVKYGYHENHGRSCY